MKTIMGEPNLLEEIKLAHARIDMIQAREADREARRATYWKWCKRILLVLAFFALMYAGGQ